jgi:hypothetical protein
MPHLARITLYPIKSLPGIAVPEAMVLPSGALRYDRQFAIQDAVGQFVTGKRLAKIHRLRSRIDPAGRTIELLAEGVRQRFHLDGDREELELWLSSFFEMPVTLVENAVTGFPDDLDSPGPTVIGTSTLAAVAAWFPGMDADEAALRFRANLEIEGLEPFGEDRLVGEVGHTVQFRIGEVIFEGTNPCQRCVVPTRDPADGSLTPDFAKVFAERRQQTLPVWAPRSRFDHFFRLAVNTRAAGVGLRMLQIGDEFQIL